MHINLTTMKINAHDTLHESHIETGLISISMEQIINWTWKDVYTLTHTHIYTSRAMAYRMTNHKFLIINQMTNSHVELIESVYIVRIIIIGTNKLIRVISLDNQYWLGCKSYISWYRKIDRVLQKIYICLKNMKTLLRCTFIESIKCSQKIQKFTKPFGYISHKISLCLSYWLSFS